MAARTGGSETLTRVAVAAVGIPVAVFAVYRGRWVLAAFLGVVAALVAHELCRLAALKGARPLALVSAAGAAGIVTVYGLTPWTGPTNGYATLILSVLTLVACTAAIWTRGVAGAPLLSVAVTVFAVVYASLLKYAVFIRHLPCDEARPPVCSLQALEGTLLVLGPVALTWVSDSAAYFGGRMWGKRKLIPSVSPGKTVAGAVSAVVGATLAGAAYAALVQPHLAYYRPTLVQGALLGLVVSVVAQVGDLAESLFKRDAGAKDSGTLFPGHGGALDRFDSLLFTLPVGYVFLRVVVQIGA
ncbi:MAG TPA: phosphatidate cytidylyltransferase [Longimicrobium sp.]|nr:phosphatidate cytidylyltransferase [Longimicrobium sp.]